MLVVGRLEDLAGRGDQFAGLILKLAFRVLIRRRPGLPDGDTSLAQLDPSPFAVGITCFCVVRASLDELIQELRCLLQLVVLLYRIPEGPHALHQRHGLLIRNELEKISGRVLLSPLEVKVENRRIVIATISQSLKELHALLGRLRERRGHPQQAHHGKKLRPIHHGFSGSFDLWGDRRKENHTITRFLSARELREPVGRIPTPEASTRQFA